MKWVEEKGEEAPLPSLNLTHHQVFFLSYAQVSLTPASLQGSVWVLLWGGVGWGGYGMCVCVCVCVCVRERERESVCCVCV